MEARKKADLLIENNEDIIRDTLFVHGYMFDNQLSLYITAPVARELPNSIEAFFNLNELDLECLRVDEDTCVVRNEVDPITRSCGIIYFSNLDMTWQELEEIAKKHYKLSI